MIKRFAVVLTVLSVCVATWAPVQIGADLADVYTHDEAFDSTTHRDAANTTARWDTTAGQLRLPPPAPSSEAVWAQLHDATSWAAALYVPDGNLVYLVGGSGARDGVQAYDPVANTTTKLAVDLPLRLEGTAGVYVPSRDSVYLFGGSAQRHVVVVDLTQKTATMLEDRLPAPFSYATAVYVPAQDKAYIFGGTDWGGSERSTILQYDLAANTAVTLPVTLSSPATLSSSIYDPVTNSAYLFGGEALGYTQPTIWKFDVATQTITTTATLPATCSGTAAVYAPPDKAYVFGGMVSPDVPLKQIVEFDIASQTVTALTAELPGERAGAGAAYVPGLNKAVILGGQYGPFVLPDVVAFDPTTQTATDLTTAWDGRDGAAGAYVPAGRKVYLFGGRSGPMDDASQSIVAFDSSSGAVSTLSATLPSSRRDAAAAYVPTTNQIYVFGGRQPGRLTDVHYADIHRFDVASQSLNAAGVSLPSARAGMSAVYVPDRDKVYLFGGVGDAGTVDEILAYDPAQNQLTTLEATLPDTAAHTAAAYDATTGKVFLFGGWSLDADGYSEAYLNQIVAFDVATETTALVPARMPLFLHRAAALAVPGESGVYVIGGMLVQGSYRQIFRFDTKLHELTLMSLSLAEGRAGEVVAYVPETGVAYLFGGLGSRQQPLLHISQLRFSYPLSATAQSLKVSQPGQQVHEALLYTQQSLHGGAVSYWLSNDGGRTWASVQPGVKHEFPAAGSDLRWRAVLSGDGRTTPIVEHLTIHYDHVVLYRMFLPVIVRNYAQ
jgi:N-acetylneuraminic acid mutarotase